MKITPARKGQDWPKIGTRDGITVRFYKTDQERGGKTYTTFMVRYSLLGRSKLKGFADWADATKFADDTCEKIANGKQEALQLTNEARTTYLRAVAALPPGISLDGAARDYAEVIRILAGRAAPVEAAREWVKRNQVELPRISVTDAAMKLKSLLKADGKSQRRQQQVAAVLDAFAENFNCEVHTLTPAQLGGYLAGLQLKERTKRNHRDVLKYFSRWLVTHGYLPKGTDLLEGVQNYSARHIGDIEIYSPEEIAKLLLAADKRLVPFLAIGAFAGLRHAEIARLDWSNIDFDDEEDGTSEPVIEVGADKSKNKTRRLVPMKASLRAWLEPHRKTSGKVCPFVNTTKQLLKAAKDAGVTWKHNGLRHSCISYRVAESGDVPRVADESDNSPGVIREHYLKRVKTKVAERWFANTPKTARAIASGEPLPTEQKIVSIANVTLNHSASAQVRK